MTDVAINPSRVPDAGEIRLVVFDWDGTLMDSEAQIVSCLHAAISDLSLEAMDDATVKNVIGLGLREAIDTLVPGKDAAFHEAFVEHYRRHWFSSAASQLFEGAWDML
ncbi:MAG: HAD hydrolase-like protein, partial [Gammaproteobacteria bacterium]|nr:HAD hydrolase-like protein [Gammaproteobacteria bacterium]